MCAGENGSRQSGGYPSIARLSPQLAIVPANCPVAQFDVDTAWDNEKQKTGNRRWMSPRAGDVSIRSGIQSLHRSNDEEGGQDEYGSVRARPGRLSHVSLPCPRTSRSLNALSLTFDGAYSTLGAADILAADTACRTRMPRPLNDSERGATGGWQPHSCLLGRRPGFTPASYGVIGSMDGCREPRPWPCSIMFTRQSRV
ncbi:hypothetical protein EXIGLDRAFT_181318 [Exidia glandulosa HHB12029]|uniref:Uncharacterized protein n=1 Tax=Exidia glandulosa HHB12029 TaxID=1314781 RepID=A0A165F2N0_EXIGL|nr:hypothetical protein EXIGLDRAFT_181318 [Exidia glandulosa HHB12029]